MSSASELPPVTVSCAPSGDRGLVLGLAIQGKKIAAVGGQGGDLLLTSNDGRTFKEVRSGGKGLRGAFIRDVPAKKQQELWVVGEWGYVAKSSDGGTSWTKISSKTKGCLFGVVADNDGNLWIAGDDGYLAVSTNGTKFTQVKGVRESIARIWTSPLGVLVPSDAPGHLYIARNKKTKPVVKTGVEAKADLMSAIVTPAGTLITVGMNGGVFRSSDNGDRFKKITVPTKAMLTAVECFEDGRVVIVGDSGIILISNDDGKTFDRLHQHAAGGTLWCCRRYGDVLLIGGEDGTILTLGEITATDAAAGVAAADPDPEVTEPEPPVVLPPPKPATLRTLTGWPASPQWNAPAPSNARQVWEPPPPLPFENRDGVYVTPELRAMLYPRRGGIATHIRPLPTLEEAWAAVRRTLWAADRVHMEKEEEKKKGEPGRSGIWEYVTSDSKKKRTMGERFLNPSPRVGTFEEDADLIALSFERYSTFIADFHDELFEALADFLVVSVGLTEAIRRCYHGLIDELPYVGVGPFGRLRELLVLASDAEMSAARAIILDSCATEAARAGHDEDRLGDIHWVATFLLPLGPKSTEKDALAHEKALGGLRKFGSGVVHPCGLASGDVATLERYRKANGKTRHEFFSPFNGRMYLASIVELAGTAAAPVLAQMKPDDPWEKDAYHNTLWCRLIAHIDHPSVLDALYKEHEKEGYVWGTAGLVLAARIDKERVLAFANKKKDKTLISIIESETSRPDRSHDPPIATKSAKDPGELCTPIPYVPREPRREVILPTRGAPIEPEATWRDEERAAAQEQDSDENDHEGKWDDTPVRRAPPEVAEAFIKHREKWRIPTTIDDLVVAPRSIHNRLMALGFSLHEYTVRFSLSGVMLRGGLTHLPVLRAALEDPETWENALEVAQPFGDVSFVPAIAKAFAGKKNKALARSWLLRHPKHAIGGALAMSAAASQDDAARILRYLDGRGHRETIISLAQAYDAAAVTTMLDEDPLAAPKVKPPVLPKFASASLLPKLVATDPKQKKVDPKAVDRLLLQLAFSNADEVHPGVLAAKAQYTPASRAAFAWKLFETWLAKKADAKLVWCMQAVGFLGDDDSARKLTALAKQWPGENASARAQAALDTLLNIGTDAALININLLAEKSKFPAFKAAAKERIEAIASARGLTADELADRLVPTLGLEEKGARTLNYGSRKFEIVFGEDLLPKVRGIGKGADPKVLADLPNPLKSDDKGLAKEAKAKLSAIKKDARASASLQIARMERAMRTGRPIASELFLSCFATHPWMSHLARRFVWGAFEEDTSGLLSSTFRVAEDGTLASIDDKKFMLGPKTTVVLLHPLVIPKSELDRWGQVFAEYEILQPFPQLSRPVFAIEESERASTQLSRFTGRQVGYSSLRGLESRGWERWYDASVQMARRLGKTWVVLDTEPGWHPSQTADEIEPQRIEGLRLLQGSGFGDLSPLAFSEIVYDLETITTTSSS